MAAADILRDAGRFAWERGKRILCGTETTVRKRVVKRIDIYRAGRCFDEVADICFCCGEVFPSGARKTIEYEDEYVDVCPACMPAHTFLCRRCEERKLKRSQAISKYVPAEAMLCSRCVDHCDACGIALADEQAYTAFYRSYCPVCWREKHAPCPYCGADFVPENGDQPVCLDCTEMRAYVQRVERMDFSRYAYKHISYYGLEHMDRCELFTQLTEHCEALKGKRYRQPEGEPYHFLVMRFRDYEVVVTHLPDGVPGAVKNAANITMTEFRKNRGMYAAYHALERWLKCSDTYVSTPTGRMLIVNYPVLLRVQTAYDKSYGKQWNGPGDYIEIGNYGDTIGETTAHHYVGTNCSVCGQGPILYQGKLDPIGSPSIDLSRFSDRFYGSRYVNQIKDIERCTSLGISIDHHCREELLLLYITENDGYSYISLNDNKKYISFYYSPDEDYYIFGFEEPVTIKAWRIIDYDDINGIDATLIDAYVIP